MCFGHIRLECYVENFVQDSMELEGRHLQFKQTVVWMATRTMMAEMITVTKVRVEKRAK